VGICVGVDQTDRHGVWWWEPGQSGCSTRSTGPGVFPAVDATVVLTAASAPIDVRFRQPRMLMPSVDVQLTILDGYMLVSGSAQRVSVEQRNDLDIPSIP
jgi:hypothetical protein